MSWPVIIDLDALTHGESLQLSTIKKIQRFIKTNFSSGKQIAGVDIGASSVKIAVIEGSEKSPTLTNFSIVPLPEGTIIQDEIQRPEDLAAGILEASENVGANPLICAVGISGTMTTARKLQLAGGTDEEIEDQVLWEAEQYLPFDIDTSTLDFHLVGENEGGGVDVIIGAAKNELIESYKDVVEETGGIVKVVDLGILAVTNIFELVMGKNIESSEESYLILDIGAAKTFFIIYKGGMMVFSKEVEVGGGDITEEIQRQMGLNYQEAEDLKIHGDPNGNLPEEILEIIDIVTEKIFGDIKKTIDFYVSSTSDESLVGCFVTGGGALIPGLLEGLEALLGVDVSVLNPFDAISYNEKKFTEEEINQIAYQGVQALGLAMRKP